MTFRQIVRSGDFEEVPPHEHDATDISGRIIASVLSPKALIGLESGLGVIIAASDTPTEQRRLARFKCDGVDDEEEFIAARELLGGSSGVIRALPGNYSFGAKFVHGESGGGNHHLLAHGAFFDHQSGYAGTLLEVNSDEIVEGGWWNSAEIAPTAPVIDVVGFRVRLVNVRASNNGGSPSLSLDSGSIYTPINGGFFDDVLVSGEAAAIVATVCFGDLTLDATSVRNRIAAAAVFGTYTDSGTDNEVAAVHGAFAQSRSMVSARGSDVTATGMSTTEGVKATATLAIPSSWNTYEVDAWGQYSWIDNGASASTQLTARLRIGGLAGTQIQLGVVEEIDIGAARDAGGGALAGSIAGRTATGNVAVVLTTQLAGENLLYASRFINVFARAYRTS